MIVHQYEISGKYIATYPSVENAGKTLNIAPTSISQNARCEDNLPVPNKRLTAGGFRWSYKKVDSLTPFILKHRTLSEEHREAFRNMVLQRIKNNPHLNDRLNKPVAEVDRLNNIVKLYKSISDAAHQVGVSISWMSLCCRHKGYRCKGKFYKLIEK